MKNRLKKIVVMGGSFNPPTIAHYRLMKASIDAVDADMFFSSLSVMPISSGKWATVIRP